MPVFYFVVNIINVPHFINILEGSKQFFPLKPLRNFFAQSVYLGTFFSLDPNFTFSANRDFILTLEAYFNLKGISSQL